MTQMKTVEPHIAVGHDAVEVYKDTSARVNFGQRELLAIPADARRQKAARAASRIVLGKRAFDAPVVRHGKLSPRSVSKVRLLRARRIAFEETPVGVERRSDARLCTRRRRGRCTAGRKTVQRAGQQGQA